MGVEMVRPEAEDAVNTLPSVCYGAAEQRQQSATTTGQPARLVKLRTADVAAAADDDD